MARSASSSRAGWQVTTPSEYGVFHSGGAAAFLDDGDGPAVEAFGVSAFAKHREPLEPIPLAT